MAYTYTHATVAIGAKVRHPLFCAEYGVGEIIELQDRNTAEGGMQALCRFPGSDASPGEKVIWLKLTELRCPRVLTRRIDNLRKKT